MDTKRQYIACDFETYLISAEEPSPRPVCLSYYFEDKLGKGHEGLLTGRESMEAFLFKILSSDLIIIAHNFTFEFLVTWHHFPKLRELLKSKMRAKELKCTQIYGRLLNNISKINSKKESLDAAVLEHFKVDISETKSDPDAWRLRYSELDGVPLDSWPEAAKRYAIDDSIWAYKLFAEQSKTPMDIDLSVSADAYLNLMGQFGILVDSSRVLTLEQEILDILTAPYLYFNSIGYLTLKQFNGYNAKGEKKWKVLFRQSDQKIFKQGEIIPVINTKEGLAISMAMGRIQTYILNKVKDIVYTEKGKVSTTAEALKLYLGEHPQDEILLNLCIIKTYSKIQSAFVSRLKEADPVIRTRYKSVVRSGRTSSKTMKDIPSVNIQQMPRTVPNVTWDIRNCFIPRPGYKICSIDYAGLELASTANQLKSLLGMHDMLDIINSGDKPVDMHSMLAYRIMNIKEKTTETYESFVAKKKEPAYAAYRQLAKPINLGFPGGIGYDTMRELLAQESIYPKLQILETSKWENTLTGKRAAARKAGYPVRIRQVSKFEYQLIYDELVLLKNELFGLYPDLKYALTKGHLNYLNGEVKYVKDKYNLWKEEPLYRFNIHGFQRDNCMYTQVCNGLLMQSPAAIGAKKAMVAIIEKYSESKVMNPLAFIHDECLMEIREDMQEEVVRDVSEILIDEMQSVLTTVRIAVEAEVCGDYWKKAGGDWSITYWKEPGNKDLKCIK